MLVLTRKANQQLLIGNDIVITVVKVRGNTIRLGIEAPRDVRVVRSELGPKPEVKAGSAAASDHSHVTSDTVDAVSADDLVVDLDGLDSADTAAASVAPTIAKPVAQRTTLKAFAHEKFKRAEKAKCNLEDSPLCHAPRVPQAAMKSSSTSCELVRFPLSQRAPLAPCATYASNSVCR